MGVSVTRALTEKKTLKDRIESAINNGQWYNFVVGDARKPGNKMFASEDDIVNAINSSDNKVNDLINRYNKIVSAIATSNANTVIEICGDKLTVAEAIERKSSINFLIRYRNHLANELANMVNESESNAIEIDRSVRQLASSAYSGDKETKNDMIESITKQLKAESEYHVVDPLNLREKIQQMDDYIDQFKAEIDFVLSESNSITMIEIE